MHSIYNPPSKGVAPKNARVVISRPSPVPYDQWPAWAKALAAIRIDGERGVGDTANRLFHWPVAGLMSEGIVAGLALFKKSCGCARRQAEWSAMYPYS